MPGTIAFCLGDVEPRNSGLAINFIEVFQLLLDGAAAPPWHIFAIGPQRLLLGGHSRPNLFGVQVCGVGFRGFFHKFAI